MTFVNWHWLLVQTKPHFQNLQHKIYLHGLGLILICTVGRSELICLWHSSQKIPVVIPMRKWSLWFRLDSQYGLNGSSCTVILHMEKTGTESFG